MNENERPLKIGITCYPTYGGSGVLATELGKQLAMKIAPAVQGDEEAKKQQDASTQALINYYLAKREK